MTKRDGGQVWLISGCSSGFGREIGKAVIERGGRAVLTARDPARIAELLEGAEDRAIALPLDVRDKAAVSRVVAEAVERFGGIDVLVNNAGYGYQTSIEEGDEGIVRDMFETNFFGLVRLTQAVLPVFRRQRRGHVVNIGSVAGVVGVPSGGYYSASKHAVEGFSDALAGEVASLGIKVTVVEPGPFRTEFGGTGLQVTPTRIDDYADGVGAVMGMTAKQHGNQPGDPRRAAEAILDIAADGAETPGHLVLGRQTVDRVEQKFKSRLDELERWRALSCGADFPS